jgi:hypothetical protein
MVPVLRAAFRQTHHGSQRFQNGAKGLRVCIMSKQYAAHFVSWRHAKKRQVGFFADEEAYGIAAAEALEQKLEALAAEGWIIDRILPSAGQTPQVAAGFTIVVFK